MSQEFDIYREYWDYCDEFSCRRIPFYPDEKDLQAPNVTPETTSHESNVMEDFDPEAILEIINEDLKQDDHLPSQKPQVLKTTADIYHHMKSTLPQTTPK